MPSRAAPRVFIVDDDERYVAALTALFEAEGLVVVGSAPNGAEAVELAPQTDATVITMDLDMPVMDGIEATRQLAPLGVPIVIVSGSESSQRVGEALAAGATASLVKSKAPTALAPLLRAVSS